MDIDSFWELIEECRRQAQGRDERLAWLRGALSQRSLAEVVRFQVRLDEVTHEAFTWDLWAAADQIFGGWCSDDGFCYFGLWMVGLGREAFTQAVADPDVLAATPEVQALVGRPREVWNDDWPEWESLDYVAMEAYGILAGVDEKCGEAFYEAVHAEQGDGGDNSGPLGERWDGRREDEAARKLPRLRRCFPCDSDPVARAGADRRINFQSPAETDGQMVQTDREWSAFSATRQVTGNAGVLSRISPGVAGP
ncbi:hypothetical protein GCM10011583_58050 [Streptomyces camponoticapitis]|uniref:DUF4240 domain-containing protein n=1 Tax=Streptomyces camponoticapitis TaxID=1616125 RepID=A0ABQ2ENG6_9ACTN|nr:DUF4240 domain-containing protein [Streptomyces camponoticapitis]GGK18588.1 hypothetical protein GCM10011583_58050 [Streptomyces camponoticapitis]